MIQFLSRGVVKCRTCALDHDAPFHPAIVSIFAADYEKAPKSLRDRGQKETRRRKTPGLIQWRAKREGAPRIRITTSLPSGCTRHQFFCICRMRTQESPEPMAAGFLLELQCRWRTLLADAHPPHDPLTITVDNDATTCVTVSSVSIVTAVVVGIGAVAVARTSGGARGRLHETSASRLCPA